MISLTGQQDLLSDIVLLVVEYNGELCLYVSRVICPLLGIFFFLSTRVTAGQYVVSIANIQYKMK